MKSNKKKYSVFLTRYSKDGLNIEKEKVLRRTNSKMLANLCLKDRMSCFIDFYKDDGVIECTVYDHDYHGAAARCTYFNNIGRLKR